MKQASSLLPAPYVHVVFTVPEQLAPLALRNQRLFYNLLFRAASETLLEIAFRQTSMELALKIQNRNPEGSQVTICVRI